MIGDLGGRLFFGLLGVARGAVHHATHRRDDRGGPLPPVPDVGAGHRWQGHRAPYADARVPTSFTWQTDGRGHQYMQGYDQYGNPI